MYPDWIRSRNHSLRRGVRIYRLGQHARARTPVILSSAVPAARYFLTRSLHTHRNETGFTLRNGIFADRAGLLFQLQRALGSFDGIPAVFSPILRTHTRAVGRLPDVDAAQDDPSFLSEVCARGGDTQSSPTRSKPLQEFFHRSWRYSAASQACY